jgi:tetratricopeptide (TPR) repeat protein
MVSGALREAGNVSQAMGDYPAASDYFTESGEISRQQGLLNDYARTRFNLGYVAVLQGRLPAGRSKLHESLELFSLFDNRRGRAEALDGFAALAAAEGNPVRAARLLGAADASFETLGAGRWPVDLLEYQKLRAALEGRLGIDAFHTHYASGRQLSLEQALEAAAEA